MTRSIAYKTTAGKIYYNLDATQVARIAEMKAKAAADYASGLPVVLVYVSTLELDEAEFKVPVADMDELKTIVEGHLQLAQTIQLNV